MHEKSSKKNSKRRQTNLKKNSDRQSNQKVMLEKSLQQPGMREIMKIYKNWQSANEGLNPYREMARTMSTSTDHTTPLQHSINSK